VNPGARLRLFVIAAVGVGALLLWGFSGLPDFGAYRGPYGDLLNQRAVGERHVLNVVSATTFDYRGFDTMGEEFILFAAVIGVALLLRAQRDEEEQSPEDMAAGRRPLQTSDTVRVFGLGLVGPTVLFGSYLVAHGHLSPGGGFQGGVLLASALLLVYLAGEFLSFERLSPEQLVEACEAVAAATFVIVGLVGLVSGGLFLANFLPLGHTGDVFSAGVIPVLNAAVGLEVAAAFVLLSDEFLEQAVLVRRRERR
jgi:multicomponent Na+:H+ antiporter subunit B